ncbi:MAG: ABC-type dipeptide/oligopeptide/nickel transport system, permease component [uncultured archaeon A07HR67]|nr:MAG: ABC-type dipeptide/oligopeptide/nickel transport system, permease component [uncultured archaeon A07HR67]
MGTQRSDRFDEVEWDEISQSRWFEPSKNTLGVVFCTLPLALLGIYDWQVLGERTATFAFLGTEWNLEGIDYLFGFTLVLFAFYVVAPLYQNPRMTRYYWRQFKRNRPAVVSLGWLGVVFVGGLFGPLVVSAPEQSVLTGHQPPVFLSIDAANVATCVGDVVGGRCQGTLQHPLGTTQGGKDVFASIVYGMTISMQIAFITTTIVAAIGVSVGTVSAYAGGWVDETLMRFVDVVLSFPTLLMFLLILYIYGAGLGMFILVFSLFAWGGTARYVRSKSLSVSEAEYVKAGRLTGATTAQVVRRHVVPNTASSIITQLTLLVPGFLLAEAQLAFLGLGDSAVPSWGQLISAGRSDLSFAPWIVLAPGVVLFLTILAFNFLGDALLDALNPEAEAENE